MEFSADTKCLAEALDQVQEAVEKKSTIPILSHLLVEASPTGLRLAATDLEMGIRTFCPAQVKAPGGVAARRGTRKHVASSFCLPWQQVLLF